MKTSAIINLVTICAAMLIDGATATAADKLEVAFRSAKARLVAELRSTKPEVRAAALKQFHEFPVPDAANTLLLQGDLTKYPDVRRGCFEALQSFRNSEPVAKALLADVLRDLKSERIVPATNVRLFVLLCGDEPKVRAIAKQALAEMEKSRAGIPLLIALVDQLSELEDGPSAQALLRLENESVIASHSGLKRAMVQALCKLEEKEAVTRLVQAHTAAEGETRADIERRLYQISGLTPDARPDWSTWWQEKQEKFVFPPSAAAKPDPFLRAALGTKPGANVPSYYGLPLYGSRIVFVIDFSGSMSGQKLEAAKRELQNAIGALPDGMRFNMVAFNSEVMVWKKELVHVSALTKKEALVWVAGGLAAAKTNSYDALEAAISQDCDAIYFLTDGAPTGGKISNPAQIVAAISRTNRIRRATINTLGIGVGGEGNAFDAFLRDLASQNFGVYRRLD